MQYICLLPKKKIDKHLEMLVVLCGDPYGTRTHVTAVKGRCLNHLTNGPDSGTPVGVPSMVAATGFEPVTPRV